MMNTNRILSILYRFFSVKRVIFLGIILFLLIWFLPSYIVGSYISEITGTKVKADISIVEFFRCNLVFNKLIIYSPAEYNSYPAVTIYDLKLNINPFKMLGSKKHITEISDNSIIINSLYSKGANNIQDIVGNIISYSRNKEPSGNSSNVYIADTVFLRNIKINTYYYSSDPVVSRIPDIYAEKLSGSSITKTITASLAAGVMQSMKTGDDNISFWTKAWHGLTATVGVTINVASAALKITDSAVSSASRVNSSINKVNSTINKF